MLIPCKHSGYMPSGGRLYHVPKAPDMSGSNDAARAGAAISQEQWEWTKARQPKIDQQSDRMIQIGEDQYNLNRDQQVFQMGLSRKYDDRYWNSVAPMQDQMMEEAQAFDTEDRRGELSRQAVADTNMAFSSARDQQTRGLTRMGVNPNSGKFAAMQTQMSVAQASAQANAYNKVNQAARLEGYSRKVDANAMMSGMSGFSSTAAGVANAYGNSGQAAGTMGMNGMTQGGSGYLAGANGAASGLQSASGNLRANAIESAKNPGFDFVAGLATAGAKAYGASMGAPTK